MKILVVDDSPTIRAALKALLERMGHTVVEANDGEQALQMYRQDRPGLVLIDVVMPVMDGYESARHMRGTKADEWVPIIFLDRKSTRLNSSHLVISYAVFCLKKKITSK